MRFSRKGPLTRADWAARRRKVAKKRAADSKPRDAKRQVHQVDISDARKRPATAALALFTNFFFPGVGLIIFGQRKWGLVFLAVTILTVYTFWPINMAFTTGMTANYAFRREN